MKELKPNRQRAKNAITLIWVILALEIVSLISGYAQYDLLKSTSYWNAIPAELVKENDTRQQIIGILYVIAFIISAVTFILWFRRAYFNLHQKVCSLSHTEGWAVGSWFVPIINLFMPYQIMKELYHETKELLVKGGLAVHSSFTSGSLGLWWILWIIVNVFGQFVFYYSLNVESIEKLTTITIASMIRNILGIPLALITLKVIKDYANIEPLLYKMADNEVVTIHNREDSE